MNFPVLAAAVIVCAATASAQTDAHRIDLRMPAVPQLLRPLNGVIAGPTASANSTAPDLTPHFRDVGITSIRNNDYYDDRMDMEGIFNCGGATYPSWEGDPYDPKNYHWEKSDSLMDAFVDGGFEPLLRLGGEWENGLRQHDFKGPQNTVQERNWIIAALKVVERYKYWRNAAQPRFRYLNIWTEFANKQFYDRPNTDFYPFFATALDSLKRHHPDLKIGGPGLLSVSIIQTGQGQKGTALEKLLAELYRRKLTPDWFGWHHWTNNSIEFQAYNTTVRAMLNGTGSFSYVPWAGTGHFSGTEIMVDAYGLSSTYMENGQMKDYPAEYVHQLFNKQQGAALLTGHFTVMQHSDIIRTYYYRGGDPGSTKPGLAAGTRGAGLWGLFYSDAPGTYKPSANAWRLWSRMIREFPSMLTGPLPSTGEHGSRLFVLGGENADSSAALFSNPTDTTASVSLSINGKAAVSANFTINVYTVDNADDGRTPVKFSGTAMTIPPWSVALVVMSKRTNVSKPVADFEADTTTTVAGGTIVFADKSQNEPTEWLWTFPGGAPQNSADRSPAVRYTAPGVYSVSLRASNSAGYHEITRQQYITVKAPSSAEGEGEDKRLPVISFRAGLISVSPRRPCAVLTVWLTDFAGRTTVYAAANGECVTIPAYMLPAGLYFLRCSDGFSVTSQTALLD